MCLNITGRPCILYMAGSGYDLTRLSWDKQFRKLQRGSYSGHNRNLDSSSLAQRQQKEALAPAVVVNLSLWEVGVGLSLAVCVYRIQTTWLWTELATVPHQKASSYGSTKRNQCTEQASINLCFCHLAFTSTLSKKFHLSKRSKGWTVICKCCQLKQPDQKKKKSFVFNKVSI